MTVYQITSFRGGISDNENSGIEGSFKSGSGADIRKFEDTLSCQDGLVDETGVTFSGVIRFFVVATDGNTYGFTSTGRIYKRDTNRDWSLVYTDPDGAITGAYEWPSDAGLSYIVWATATKLHCKELPGASNWSDVDARATFPKSDLSSADWHTMRDSGGDLVISNKNNLAALGYDSSYSPNVLDLVPGTIVKTLVERHGRTILGTGRAAYPNKGINALIESEVPLAQVGDDGAIFFADMTDTVPATRFPGGGRVNPGGVDLDTEQVYMYEWAQAASSNPDVNSWTDKKAIGGMALFGVFGADAGLGGVWTYGRKRKNHPFALNLDYPFDADEIGAVKKVGDDIIFSYTLGGTFGVKRVSSTVRSTLVYEGLVKKSPVKRSANITPWKTVELVMKPLPAGCSVQFYYRMNKKGAFVQASQEDGSTSYTTADGESAVFLVGEEGKYYEPKVICYPNGSATPEIYAINTYLGEQ